MNKLEKLISELIPNGVRYVKLKDVCEISLGTQLNKSKLLSEGKYAVRNGGIEPSGYWNEYNTDENTITISQGGASAGYVNFQTEKFWSGAHCYTVKLKHDKTTNYKYLYYFLKNEENNLMQNQVGAGIPSVSRNYIYSLKIPFPPIKVQDEIVRILDTITELTSKLRTELEMRKKQYEFYLIKITSKEYLSKSKEEIKTKYLGEVVKIKNGKDWKKLKQGKVPVYGSGGNMEIFVDEFSYSKETVLIPRKGTIKNVYYLDEPFWNVDTIYYTEVNEKLIIPKYLYYLLNQIDLTKLSINSTRPSLTQEIIKKIKLVLPPISVQQEIVNILDKFEKLCNSLTEGIPAEIEMRQKQYEYYRNKLFNFEKINEKNIEKIGEKIG